jgi:uncharacterized protein
MNEYGNAPVTLDQIPQFQTLEFTPLEDNYRLLKTIESALIWLVLIIAFSLVNYLVDEIRLPIYFHVGLISLGIISTVYQYHAANARGYILREHDILAKEGLFWRKRTGVSFKRIQHIDLTHGPIERKFSIATIKFFTAGGAMADLKIVGLAKYRAESIRSFILERTSMTDD